VYQRIAMPFRPMTLFLFMLQFHALAVSVSAQDLIEQGLRIPAPGAGKKKLEAIMVRPNEPGPHPLALVNHGAPRAGSDRRKMTPWDMLPQAKEFARRGWIAVVVMRRGYGDSGGDFAEDAHACGRDPDFHRSGVESANDLRAAIEYLSKLPEVDPTRIISVGRSAGGFATVALTAKPPAGLVAGISFAGGRGSPAKDEVCNPADLINAFRDFGKKSRIPMLWVYAKNDHFFSPQIAAEFYRVFTAGGGKVQFVSADSFGADGHGLFSMAGIPIWTPMVDDFLQSQNLVLPKTLLAPPEPSSSQLPGMEPSSQLSEPARAEFQQFPTFPMHRAFAISPNGQFSIAFRSQSKRCPPIGHRALREARRKERTLQTTYCGRSDPNQPADHQLAADETSFFSSSSPCAVASIRSTISPQRRPWGVLFSST
jgi:dienelactone hydrolase